MRIGQGGKAGRGGSRMMKVGVGEGGGKRVGECIGKGGQEECSGKGGGQG